MTIIFSLAAVAMTIIGGLLALRFKDKLHLTLALSAGAVLGVALFDLLPEALELAEPFGVSVVMLMVALGFVAYLVLNNTLSLHTHSHDNCENKNHSGVLGAGSLTVHSLIDGMAIGLAFQASELIGITVAIAVLAHKLSDGLNTVNLILHNDGSHRRALQWLGLASAAPIIGALSTLFFTISPAVLGLTLAVIAGSFLYIGASDLIPESHHNHPAGLTTAMIIVGLVLMYAIVTFAGR